MAHTKSQGKTNQKSNRPGQRRGVKKFGGQKAEVGQIIVRQVGSSFRAGEGTKLGKHRQPGTDPQTCQSPGAAAAGRLAERLCAVLLHAVFAHAAQHPHRLGRYTAAAE